MFIRLAEQRAQFVFDVERHVVVVYHRDDRQLKWMTSFETLHAVRFNTDCDTLIELKAMIVK